MFIAGCMITQKKDGYYPTVYDTDRGELLVRELIFPIAIQAINKALKAIENNQFGTAPVEEWEWIQAGVFTYGWNV